MKLLIASDTAAPDINGVAVTLSNLTRHLRDLDVDARIVSYHDHLTVPCPTYAEVRLAVRPSRWVAAAVRQWTPNAVHIATEGPIGWAMRRWCLAEGMPFTTAYHTHFPRYIAARLGFGSGLTFALLRRFHQPSKAVLVPTHSVQRELAQKRFARVSLWSRGVDLERFRPAYQRSPSLPRPIWLFVGRIAVEKNIEQFLALDLPGTKVIVGDGPARKSLEARYPTAVFAGFQRGQALVALYQQADVFVFPSRTDTFGLVMIEAMACGTPVAAFPDDAPMEVVEQGVSGFVDEDLRTACLRALGLNRHAVRQSATRFSWATSAEQFARLVAAHTVSHPSHIS